VSNCHWEIKVEVLRSKSKAINCAESPPKPPAWQPASCHNQAAASLDEVFSHRSEWFRFNG